MRLDRRLGWIALATMFSGCALHTAPAPSTDIDETGFRDAIQLLVSNDFQGRRPGTPAEDKTVAYLVDRFKKLGLKPGNGDSYLQAVPLVEITPAADASLSIATRAGGRTTTNAASLVYGRDMVVWSPREVPESVLVGSELVFVGYGVDAPEYSWNDYAQADVRGKTVLILTGDPGHGAKDPGVFRGGAMTRFGTAEYKFEEAARHGAAGVLLIHDEEASGMSWNAIVNSRTGPQFETPAADAQGGRAAIEGWVTAAVGRDLLARAGGGAGSVGGDALKASAARPGFKVTALGLEVGAAVHNTLRRFTSSNVMGVLPGGRLKHEYVMFASHWDALGRAAAAAGGAMLSGAVDDASGVAGMLMEAQALARTRPSLDRSVLFVAFTAAEGGWLGSRFYVQNPPVPLGQIAAVLSLDTLRLGGPTRDVMVWGDGNSELEDYLHQAALLQGRIVTPDPEPGRGAFLRADHFNFVRNGVPALAARFGTDDTARGPAWGRVELDDYWAHRYRQAADTYAADRDVRGTLDDLRLYYEVAVRLGETRSFPRWYPNSDYRSGDADKRESGG